MDSRRSPASNRHAVCDTLLSPQRFPGSSVDRMCLVSYRRPGHLFDDLRLHRSITEIERLFGPLVEAVAKSSDLIRRARSETKSVLAGSAVLTSFNAARPPNRLTFHTAGPHVPAKKTKTPPNRLIIQIRRSQERVPCSLVKPIHVFRPSQSSPKAPRRWSRITGTIRRIFSCNCMTAGSRSAP